MEDNITSRIHYSLKGIISRNNNDTYTIPNTPLFKTEEEATLFYEKNKDCESLYNWKKWRSLGIYKVTISEEICRFM